MIHTYNISGTACGNCVAKAKSQLLVLGDVEEANRQLATAHATITMHKHIPVNVPQNALSKTGPYLLREAEGGMHHMRAKKETPSLLTTYKPIHLIGAYITKIILLLKAAIVVLCISIVEVLQSLEQENDTLCLPWWGV